MASQTIPDSHLKLITDPVYITLSTVSPDGYPENSVVWGQWDGEHIIIGTTRQRRKAQNILKHPKVAVFAMEPGNPYRWIDIRGEVTEVSEDVGYKVIDSLTELYTDEDKFYGGVAPAELEGTQDRVVLKIKPERVAVYPE